MQHLINVHDIHARLRLDEAFARLRLDKAFARLRQEGVTVDRVGRGFTFVVVFAVGWYLMLWAWGGLVGGLMGWIPAVGLAAVLSTSWRTVLVGGLLLGALQLSGKIV